MPQDNPFSKYKAAPGSVVLTDPYKPREQQRADKTVDISASNLELNRGDNARADRKQKVDLPQSLRQEFEKNPDVVAYRTALRMSRQALNTANNPQGDLALTYAFAKAMDPTSSVREGEQTSVSNSQPAVQAIMERIKKEFGVDGAGNFTDIARSNLRSEILKATLGYKPLYDARRSELIDNAKANGLDPYSVVGKDDTMIYAPDLQAYAKANGDPGGAIGQLLSSPGAFSDKPIGAGPDLKAAGPGATTDVQAIPKEMDQASINYIYKHWGNIDKQDFVRFRSALDMQYGFGSNPDQYAAFADKANDLARKGNPPSVIGAITPPSRNLSNIEQGWNSIVSSPTGTAIATTANGIGAGIPELLAGDKFDAMRRLNPKSAMAGDIAGAVGGTMLGGGALRGGASMAERQGLPTVARALTNPLTADVAYGGVYGANTAAGQGRNPLTGALEGVALGAAGNRVGRALGRAMPWGRGALDASVPTSDDLKTLASGLYTSAEGRGLTATPTDTLALADTTSDILSNEGRLSPTGRLTDVQPKVKEAYNLIGDYGGQPMRPTEFQTVRGVISDGLSSNDASERRVARLLLNNFDNWGDGTNPDLAEGLSDAREVASRYLQGDRLTNLEELAAPGAAQYSQSGAGNALRTQYRALDRSITRGTDTFSPNVEEAVRNVARGTPGRNMLRYFGKMAPTGQMSMLGLGGLGAAGAAATGNASGAIPALLLGGIGTAARQTEAALARRAARVAELSAYGGPEYTDALDALLAASGRRAGDVGAAAAVTSPDTTSEAARAYRMWLNPNAAY